MPKITNQTTGASAECPAGSRFREVVQRNNLDVPFGCESGICSTCLIQIKSGSENLGQKTEQEKFTLGARGVDIADMKTRLGCQCTVTGDVEFQSGL